MSERYQKIKHRTAEKVAPTRLALEAGISLFRETPSNPTVRRKVLYDELASTPITEPLNREDNLYGNFLSVIKSRQIPVSSLLQEKNLIGIHQVLSII